MGTTRMSLSAAGAQLFLILQLWRVMTRPLIASAAAPRADAISSSLPTRKAFHLSRKFFHFLSGYAYAFLTRNLASSTWRTLMFALVMVVFVVELSRIRSPDGFVNRVVLSSFRSFMRRHEAKQFSGMLYYTLGVAITASYFSTTAACVGVLSLSIADPIAALVGFSFDPLLPEARLPNGKSVAGFVFAAFVAIFTVFTLFCCAAESSMDLKEALIVSIPIGISAAFTEVVIPSPQLLLPFRFVPLGLDDNLFIPIVSAAVCDYLLAKRIHDVHLSPFLLWK